MNGSVLAAISPQWIGIAVAAAIVVALLVILVIRRARDGKSDGQPGSAAEDHSYAIVEIPQTTKDNASFLDQPLQGGFEGLGKSVSGQPSLGTIVMPKDRRPEPAPQQVAPSVPAPAAVPDDAAGETSAPEPPATPQATPPADPGAAPLSEILVTTNQQEIDLTDPEVRQMLEDLVASEIALAEVYRQQGQILDAILELTEAEKACTALGNSEQAERIKALMKELQP